MSSLQDFVKAISDIKKQFTDPRKEENAVPNKTFGGLAGNFAHGVGQMAEGLVGLPKAAIGGVMHPETVGPGIENTLKGLGTSVNNTVGQPINPTTGALQMPSLQEANNFVYTNPVDVAANTLMAGGAMGKLGKIAKGGEVADATKIAESGATKLPPIEEPIKTKSMITKVEAPSDVVANYNSVFQVPRRIVQNMRIKPETIINQLINDGVTGVKNLDELDSVAKSVTGDGGAFPTINRTILSDIENPIDYTDARTAAKNATATYLEGSKGGLINDVNHQITGALPNYEAPAGNLPSMMPENHAYASDLFTSTQKLDNVANMYKRKAYTAMGELSNPDYERAANAVQEVSNNIKDSLDKSVPNEMYQAYKSDPRVVAQLQRLPGGIDGSIAKRWINDSKQFRDGRAIQAPYVGLQNMIDYTKDAQLSASSQLINKLGEAQPSEGISNALLHPKQAVAGILEKGLKSAFSQLDNAPEDIMAAKTSGASATLKPTVKVPSSVGGVINGSMQSVPAIVMANKQDQSVPQNVAGAITTKPTSSPVTGKYSIVSPFEAGLAQGDLPLANQMADLQTKLGEAQKLAQTDSIHGDQQSAVINGQIKALNEKIKAQGGLVAQWTQTNNDVQALNKAAGLVDAAPPSLLQLNGTFDKLTKQGGSYAKLAVALKYLQDKTGVNLDDTKTKEGLQAAMDQAFQNLKTPYDTSKQQFTGNANGKASPVTPQAPITNLPPIGPSHLDFNMSSPGQGLPAIQ